jgi:AcrR family transcriptional regulator
MARSPRDALRCATILPVEADRQERTKEALTRAAEQLMAARGVNAVDLKQIQIAAGQKNRSVVNYYFGDRAGLITAIMTKHRLAVNAERHRMLDRIEHPRSALRRRAGRSHRALAGSQFGYALGPGLHRSPGECLAW